MSDERIDIEIGDGISPKVNEGILKIVKSLRTADSAVIRLKESLASMNDTALNKLANASSKLTNANARLLNANSKMALVQQKVATETERTRAAQERANAAASRATATSLRLSQAQGKLANSVKRTSFSLATLVKTALIYSGISFAGQNIVQGLDAYTILQNKLTNVAESQSQLAAISQEVFEIAKRTRAPVDDVAQAFQRFDLAMIQLGASQRESLDLTETVNKALVLSGATTGEQASALLQLSQAFNKGKLDGDEFRSVMELMPSAADAIAKELVVTRGELLKLAPQGKITAEVMRRAFARAKDEIAGKFAKVIPTISQSFIALKNEAIRFFGEMNARLGISRAFANVVLKLADNIKLLGVAASAAGVGLLVAFGPKVIAGITALSAAIASNPIGLLIVGLSTAIALFMTFKDDIKLSEDGVVSLGDTVNAVFSFILDTIAPLGKFIKDVFFDAIGFVNENFGGMFDFVSEVFKGMLANVKFLANGFVSWFDWIISTITKGWDLIPGAFRDAMSLAFNYALDIAQNGVNKLLQTLQTLLGYINKARTKLGFEPIELNLEAIDLSGFKAKVGKELGSFNKIFNEEFNRVVRTDYVGDAFNGVLSSIDKRAREFAAARALNKEGVLRGASTPKLPAGDTKELEKRAAIMDKVMRTLRSEISLLNLVGPQREIEARFNQINNDLLNKKVKLTNEEAAEIRSLISTLEREKQIQSELQSIYDSSTGGFQKLADGLEATKRAYKRGFIGADEYNQKLVELNSEATKLKFNLGNVTWGEAFTESLRKIVDGYQGFIPAMSETFGNLFKTLSDGFANSIGRAVVYAENLGTALKDVAKGALADLISATIKSAIQFVVYEGLKQDAIGATILATNAQAAAQVAAATTSATAQVGALATTTAASTASAATTTAAWTPAAAVTSIGSFGGAAAIGLAALIAAVGAAKVAGFESGGYTGNGGRSDFAGIVHGREFVMNASATERIGVGNLKMLQNGAASVQQSRPTSSSTQSVGNSSPSQDNASNRPVVNLKTINLVDSSMLGDYLSSNDSDDVFVNKIARNSEEIRGALGV